MPTPVADIDGVITGKFTIPAGVRAGAKTVHISGDGGSHGDAVFVGAGEARQAVMQRVTVVNRTDPLAETFTVPVKAQIAGIDLYVENMGTTPLVVQIRDTEVGFPTRTVLAEARVSQGDVTEGDWNRILFPVPVTLSAGQEYAIVVQSGDAVTSVGIAELGKADVVSHTWVTSQPYQIGVLLSSSNAVTWTAHQDRDLTFRLLSYGYSPASRTIDLGVVAVTDATDLMVRAVADIPDEATRIEYRLTLPDSRVITVSSDQPLRLAAAITGDVQVEALLYGTAEFSPVLYDAILVHGTIATSGTYIGRAMLAGPNSRVQVVYEALLPPGASVDVEVSGIDPGDTYATVPQTGTQNFDNGYIEFTHEIADVDENQVRIRLTLHGGAGARPDVKNIRCMVM